MAEKDIIEKTLIAYNDVFADIVNVLLFNGKSVVKEEELSDAVTKSMYKADGKLHEMERDVAKYWRHSRFRIAMIGIENETEPEREMPLRLFGYDGSGYRAQLLDKSKEKSKKRKPVRHRWYPVVSLVLYFGNTHWEKNRTLKEVLTTPPELEPFVNDYRINLFEISFLSEEQIAMFQSDFRFVAEFFMKQRTDPAYTPTKMEIQHVDEVLKLLSVFSGDERFLDVIEGRGKIAEKEGGKKIMSSAVLDYREAKGEARGIAIGEARGEAKGIKKGQNILVEAVQRLRTGETAKEIIKSGVDEDTVRLAQTIR